MRILVTGAEGRLGGELVTQLRLQHHDVIGVDIGDFDITDFAVTRAYVRDIRPEFIIHPAAWTDVDGCAHEPEKALDINGYGTQHIALAAADVDAPLLYVSSNEVFDGEQQEPYLEYDPTHPVNAYGYSKWVGERVVIDLHPAHYIVRTSWLFAHGGRNFIQSILNAAADRRSLRVVTDEVASPTYNHDLAVAITQLIETERYGIYHFVNDGACSRYEFARYILDNSGHADVPIEAITQSDWPRASMPPAYSVLRNLAGRAMGITLRSWQQAVDAFLEREDLSR